MRLYLNCRTDYTIRDDQDKQYSIDEARRLVNAGKVTDSNLAFKRLVNMDYDLEAIKEYYNKGV
jgi:hypothetical protein